MHIARIEAFQVQWRPEDPPSARSGFLRVWSDDGRCGLGEVSPMQGGLVSLTILKHHIAPAVFTMWFVFWFVLALATWLIGGVLLFEPVFGPQPLIRL